MLLVKTYVGPSAIAGTGCFAKQDIKKGTLVWKHIPGFDAFFNDQQWRALPPAVRANLSNYLAKNKKNGHYNLFPDDTKYINHSNTPSVSQVFEPGEIDVLCYATRDIKKGEELTFDYSEVCNIWDERYVRIYKLKDNPRWRKEYEAYKKAQRKRTKYDPVPKNGLIF